MNDLPSLPEGARIDGRYDITGLPLGAGVSGVVYPGVDPDGRELAIKILRSNLLVLPETVERFKREIHILGMLDHPHVVASYGSGTLPAGNLYLVMERVRGPSFADRLRKAPLAAGLAVGIVVQVLDALAALHQEGVVHRDLKPANILLDEGAGADFAKVGDFGLARPPTAEELPELTRTGDVFGTPHYLSPEQARGERVTPASDLYAVGVMLYLALSGELPFDGPAVDVMLAHMRDAPRPLADLAPGAPEAVVRIVMQALEKAPEDRPPSAATMAQALRDATPDLVVPAPRPTGPSVPALSRRSAVLATAACVGAVGLWLWSSAPAGSVRLTVVTEPPGGAAVVILLEGDEEIGRIPLEHTPAAVEVPRGMEIRIEGRVGARRGTMIGRADADGRWVVPMLQ